MSNLFASPALFAHVDINSYFATVLQQENPALRNKPVGVVKEVGRTCIIAASKEAKALGVGTGSRLQEVQKFVPNLVIVPANFDLYLSLTKRLQSIFLSLLPPDQVEVFSLDEAFLNLSTAKRLYPDPVVFGQQAQALIKEQLGEFVTSNVGLGPTRFLAKLAGEVSPKGSVVRVEASNLNNFLATTRFRDVCGVGFRLEKRLRALGVSNLYQLNLVTDQELQRCVGPYWAGQLRAMSQGHEPDLLRRIDQNEYMKSVGRSITLWNLAKDLPQIKQVLYNLALEVTTKARQMSLQGRQVQVALWGQNQVWCKHVTLKHFFNQDRYFYEQVLELLTDWPANFKVIKLAVRLSLLQPDSLTPRLLWPDWEKQSMLDQATDRLNDRYGLFTVKPASLLDSKLIYPEVTGFLGDKRYLL